MRILITGINGFVGGYFLNYLSQCDGMFDVLGTGRQSECNHHTSSKNIQFRYACLDLQQKEEVANLIKDFRPAYLVHLASMSSVGYSWKYPQETYVNNTLIFLNIIEQIRTLKIPCRIQSIGSGEEYGIVSENNLPIVENIKLDPSNPYAVARVSQEMIAQTYVKGYDMDIVMTRSFNHIGPGQSDQFVIASFAKKLLDASQSTKTEKSILTGDISIIRDFLDVRDVARAYYLLLTKGKKGEVYNVCSGKGIMLRDMLDMMCEMLGEKVIYKQDEHLLRPVDNKKVIGCNDKIQMATGWKPEISIYSTLNDILDEMKTIINSH